MSEINKEKLALKFLENLYSVFQKYKGKLNVSQYNIAERARKSQLNQQAIIASLQSASIVKKEGNGAHAIYTWIEKQPNGLMVKRLLEKMVEHQAYRTQIDKERRQIVEKEKAAKKKPAPVVVPVTNIVPVETAAPVTSNLTATDEQKIQNVFNALEKVYELMKSGNYISTQLIRFGDIAEKNKISAPSSFSVGMQRAGVVQRAKTSIASEFKWIAGKPTKVMAEAVVTAMRQYFREKNKKWQQGVKEKKNAATVQSSEPVKAIKQTKTPSANSQTMVARAKLLMQLGEKEFAYQLLDELL